MRFVDGGHDWDSFIAKFAAEGGVVEAFLEDPNKRAPSCQLRISPTGSLDPISTHDQLVEGVDGQVYAGCRFPADAAYRTVIQQDALRVGEVLQAEGAIKAPTPLVTPSQTAPSLARTSTAPKSAR